VPQFRSFTSPMAPTTCHEEVTQQDMRWQVDVGKAASGVATMRSMRLARGDLSDKHSRESSSSTVLQDRNLERQGGGTVPQFRSFTSPMAPTTCHEEVTQQDLRWQLHMGTVAPGVAIKQPVHLARGDFGDKHSEENTSSTVTRDQYLEQQGEGTVEPSRSFTSPTAPMSCHAQLSKQESLHHGQQADLVNSPCTLSGGQIGRIASHTPMVPRGEAVTAVQLAARRHGASNLRSPQQPSTVAAHALQVGSAPRRQTKDIVFEHAPYAPPPKHDEMVDRWADLDATWIACEWVEQNTFLHLRPLRDTSLGRSKSAPVLGRRLVTQRGDNPAQLRYQVFPNGIQSQGKFWL